MSIRPGEWVSPRVTRAEAPRPSPPLAGEGVASSQQCVLGALAFGEQRQRLAGDIGLEMRALLMGLEGGVVAEQFVEQELRGVFLCPADQEQLGAGFALRLREEALQDARDPVGLSFLCFPLRDNQ